MLTEYQIKLGMDSAKTLKELATYLDCSIPTLVKYMKMYGIPTTLKRVGKNFKLTRDQLEDLYVNQQLSLREIARMQGVSYQAVSLWMLTYNIPCRPLHEKGRPKKFMKRVSVYRRNRSKKASSYESLDTKESNESNDINPMIDQSNVIESQSFDEMNASLYLKNQD